MLARTLWLSAGIAFAAIAAILLLAPQQGRAAEIAHTTKPVTMHTANVPGTTDYEFNKLHKQIEELKETIANLQRQMQENQQRTLAAVKGVHPPVCKNDTVLYNPQINRSENCAPYICDAVQANCLSTCRGSSDCAPGYTCDPGVGNGRCVKP